MLRGDNRWTPQVTDGYRETGLEVGKGRQHYGGMTQNLGKEWISTAQNAEISVLL